MAAVDPDILVDRRDPQVWVVTLNRPARRNALTDEMFDSLRALGDEIGRSRTIRVVIITGGNDAFCAGLDLDLVGSLPEMSTSDFLRTQERWSAAITTAGVSPGGSPAAASKPATRTARPTSSATTS